MFGFSVADELGEHARSLLTFTAKAAVERWAGLTIMDRQHCRPIAVVTGWHGRILRAQIETTDDSQVFAFRARAA